MRRAFKLAQKAKGMTSPNPMVGAVIVKGNKIIAEGWHEFCGGDHAEVVALKKAGDSARGANLYVTLEPCAHFGRTPPCVDRIISSGIKEVMIGMQDPNPLTKGRSIRLLKKHKIRTRVGFLQDELRQLNESFLKYITTKMPFVTVKCAQTLDGKIATANGHSRWVTSDATRRLTHQLRNDYDAILVGINTILKDNPSLNPVPRRKSIKKIIVDSTLRLPFPAKIFSRTTTSDIFIATTRRAPQRKVAQFRLKGINVLVDPGRNAWVDLRWLMRELGRREIANILLEGGAQIIGSALKNQLVDKMQIWISPKIVGDQNARSSVTGRKVRSMAEALSLKRISIELFGSDIRIEGYV